MKYQSNRGFTLIELLISIAIIGILISTVSLNFTKSLARGRDGQRKSDILSIAGALESTYAINRLYPGDATGCGGNAYQYYSTCGNPWIPNLANYINPLPIEKGPNIATSDVSIIDNPCDGNLADTRIYEYRVNLPTPTHYYLAARLELGSDKDIIHPDQNCADFPLPFNDFTDLTNGAPNVNGFPIYVIYK